MNTSMHFKTLLSTLCCLVCACCIYAQDCEYVPGQVLVKMKPNKSMAQKKDIEKTMGATVKKRYCKSKVELWEIDTKTGKSVAQIIQEYQDHPDIAYIEPDYILKPTAFYGESPASAMTTPDDMLFDDQWALFNDGQIGGKPGIDIGAPKAWDSISTSPRIKVAVIDTGIDWGHEDLIDNIWQNLGEDADGDGRVLEYNEAEQKWELDAGDLKDTIDNDNNGYVNDLIGWDFADDDNNPFDDYGAVHGTHVAGIIGAKGNNNIGVAGVTWDVQMAALKIFGKQQSCSNAIEAIDYAVAMGFPISNNSWEFPECNLPYSLRDAIEVARDSGHLFVAAAGNQKLSFNAPAERDNDVYPIYPASFNLDNIISVTAIDRYGDLWNQAHYGATSVDIGAPGKDILSTSTERMGYTTQSGTSMAAPHVTGACALLWSLYHDKTYAEIKDAILTTTVYTPSLDGKCQTNGRLNLHNAITGFGSPPPPPLPSLCRAADSLALLQLKAAAGAINTTKWSTWNPLESMDTWYGVRLSEEGCVESLYLYSDSLSTLPAEISGLTNLKTLTMNDTQLESIPAEIESLVNLETLYLYNNKLTSLHAGMSNLSNLRVLNLSSNQFTSLASVMLSIANSPLEELYFSNNQLTYVHSFVSLVPNLKKLDLSNNAITTIAPEIGYLTNLQYLSLYDNQLTDLPSAIGGLESLETLKISRNQLTSLPSEIGNLTKLKEISMLYNTISSLPVEVSGMVSLEELDYRFNQLTSLSPNIGGIPNLKRLYLDNNDLTGLPPELGDLTDLHQLNLSHNKITSLPTTIGDLTNLHTLYIHYNDLILFPTTIGNLSKLQFLYAYGNQLTTLPSEIGSLGKLQELHLGGNQIIALPPSIGDLKDLHRLELHGNQLSTLPPEIGNLSDLRILGLSNNKFNSIPLELGNLKKLNRLYFGNNEADGCFDNNLINLCPRLIDSNLGIYNANNHIIAGNNFPYTWDEFCDRGAGVCVSNGCRQSDSLALLAIRDNTIISGWANGWNPNLPMDYWHGVTLNGLGCVVGLDLSDQNIVGSIAPEIGNLSYLRDLNFGGNDFKDSIPPEISNLQRLQTLDLSDNDLTGKIPNELGDLSDLIHLNISQNELTGHIPATLGNLNKELRIIDLSENYLTGSIPSELGTLWRLNNLYLSDNLLTGNIPDYFGRLSSLRHLHLNNNQLSGSIPYTLTNLERLEQLWLSDNDLEGCFYTGLSVLCDRLSNGFSTNAFISDGNNFPDTWENFCGSRENSCEPVRPGDFNYDGIANEEDVLSWALSYEFSGPPRQGTPTTDWRDHDAEDWQSVTLDKNSKHQDGNGDGVVDFGDIDVLELNFGKTHTLGTPLSVNANTEYKFLRIGEADEFRYKLSVINEDSSHVALHGLSFTFNFGSLEVDSVEVDLAGSSLQPDMMFSRFDALRNRWHFAITRLDNTDQLCIGPVAEFSIIISKNIPTGDPTKIMTVENGTQMTTNGILEDTEGQSIYGSVIVGRPLGSNEIFLNASVIHSDCHTPGKIALKVAGGTEPYTYSWSNGANTRDINNLRSGIYQVTVTDSLGIEGIATLEVENRFLPVYDGDGSLVNCNTIFDIRVLLEGAYERLGDTMITSLQQLSLLPEGGQPYTIAPWNYSGLEGFNWTSGSYSNDMVDWVLVSLRTDVTSNTQIAQAAAILKKDGSLYFPENIRFTSVADSAYIVIEHRNHIAVMTPHPIPIIGSTLTYDFSVRNSYNSGGYGQKKMSNGKWVMFAGDCAQADDTQGYDINGSDKSLWGTRNGEFNKYHLADMNLDGDINGLDKAFWFDNNGISSALRK